MLDSVQTLLDALPEGVIRIKEGVVLSANPEACRRLPQLAVGEPLPDVLPLPSGSGGTGEFSVGPSAYAYSYTSAGGEQMILFRPAAPSVLTDRQLDGVAYQLRTLLGEVLAEVGPATAEGAVPADTFGKTFSRLFRLLDNLDYREKVFHPVTMDLAGLCRRVEELAGPLLKEAGILLSCQTRERGLLISGDPALLQKLLLSLIANAAQAVGQGKVVLTLRRQGNRAVIVISHDGPPAGERQLDALFRPGLGEEAPRPGQGAGLGLTVARHIVALHKGSILMEWGQSALETVVSLPIGPLSGRVSVRTPGVRRDGGLEPVLMELSDVLPASLFGLEGLD